MGTYQEIQCFFVGTPLEGVLPLPTTEVDWELEAEEVVFKEVELDGGVLTDVELNGGEVGDVELEDVGTEFVELADLLS